MGVLGVCVGHLLRKSGGAALTGLRSGPCIAVTSPSAVYGLGEGGHQAVRVFSLLRQLNEGWVRPTVGQTHLGRGRTHGVWVAPRLAPLGLVTSEGLVSVLLVSQRFTSWPSVVGQAIELTTVTRTLQTA